MKKVIFFLIIGALFLLNYIVNKSKSQQVFAQQQNNTEYQVASTPTFIPTRTIIPTVTIGYEATLAVAQSTADEARRVNALVTSEAEQRLLSYVQLTADTDARAHEVAMWTQIAGATVIPLTATQQAVANTQIVAAQNIVAAGYTQQAAAPTQMAAMVQVQATAQFARANEIAKLIAVGVLCLFLFSLVAFLNRLAHLEPKEDIEPEPATETTIWVRSEKDNGAQSKRLVIPCTSQQFTELALKVSTGKKTLAINNWEGSETLFTRPVIHQVRAWLQENKFAAATGDGQLVPTEDGFAFFDAWLYNQKLPDEFQFTEPEVTPEPVANGVG
jgi:hypothetical protein